MSATGSQRPADSLTEPIKVRRALLSAYDKSGLVEFAKRLTACGVEILASGGTARVLEEGGVSVRSIDALTGFSQLFGGRLKTLTPRIHGGILLRRGHSADLAEAGEHGIEPIDLVAVDLYPYERGLEARDPGAEPDVELIDIGGPAMLRAAAKNFASVVAICDRGDYSRVAATLSEQGGIPVALSRELAAKTFRRTSTYDALIGATLAGRRSPTARVGDAAVSWAGSRIRTLRYGENPNQEGALYASPGSLWDGMEIHQGKELSFNNLGDLVRAALLAKEFCRAERATATVIKHGVPAGTAHGVAIHDALERAWNGDALSCFGGIIALTQPGNEECARFLAERFFEIAAAPSWSHAALEILATKKKRIILSWDVMEREWTSHLPETRWALDGLLLQTDLPAGPPFSVWDHVAGAPAPPDVAADLEFAWKVTRHVRSNAIVLARDGMTIGVGAGQTSRIDALDVALMKARRCGHEVSGSVLASDAFFPFSDVVERAAENGVQAIVQPGGSVRDKDSIAAAEKAGMLLYFTRQRVFTHG